MKELNLKDKQMTSMKTYFEKHKEEYHEDALVEHKEKRPDHYYTRLMKKILSWDNGIYKIASVEDFNTYISLIDKYRNDLGYSNWTDIYTDNFYTILTHGYYNNDVCQNCLDAPLNEDIIDTLENHAHTLFSNKIQNKNEYQLTRVMFKFILLVCQYEHHLSNIKHQNIEKKNYQKNFHNNKQKMETNAIRVQKHIEDIIKLCGGEKYIKNEITNGFGRPVWEALYALKSYPKVYMYNFKIDKPSIDKQYLTDYLKSCGSTQENIASFIYSIS